MEKSIAYVDAASGGNDSELYSQMAMFLQTFLQEYWPEGISYKLEHENVVSTLEKIGKQNPNMKDWLDDLYRKLLTKNNHLLVDKNYRNIRNFLLVRVLIEAKYDRPEIYYILLEDTYARQIAYIIELRMESEDVDPLQITYFERELGLFNYDAETDAYVDSDDE